MEVEGPEEVKEEKEAGRDEKPRDLQGEESREVGQGGLAARALSD